MELGLEVYDILGLKSYQSVFFDTALPQWANEFLKKVPYVVVKRGEEKTGMVSIGIRGMMRTQRFGCHMMQDNILKIYKPSELIRCESNCGIWNKAAPLLASIFEPYKKRMIFGPTGSVGFELATGYESTTKNSDLDFLIMAKEPLETDVAKELLQKLLKLNIKMDITLGIPIGYIALEEYCNGQAPYMVKSNKGVQLVQELY